MKEIIDNKVVSMQFDNKNFEKNANKSMKTLDKLKGKVDFKKVSGSLKDLEKSVNTFKTNGLTKSFDTIHAKIRAVDVAAMTLVSTLTNRLYYAGERAVKALTIDPVRTGFQEYETQINSVQTILANVGHKGKTIKDVNNALDELNEYADQTIYNFTEMTRNIGLFTNAGVDLDRSVAAIKRIF